ncbi:MAG: site-specific tyrosine recombinase [Lachnospiraceae bacterium]
MIVEIQNFITYLHQEQKAPINTEVAYQRDLIKMADYLSKEGITDVQKVTKTSLQSYILYMQEQGSASTSISRAVASMKSFFHYAQNQGLIGQSPADGVKAPKLEKKIPQILTIEEMDCLLSQPTNHTAKEVRDKAMLELLYATGMRVTELLTLNCEDINMNVQCVTCHTRVGDRIIPFGSEAKRALREYLAIREEFVTDNTGNYLFLNCGGGRMSRQGFWKIIKYYAKEAGITKDITPHTLRHSFAAHMIANGADLKDVQEMMGHADISTTHVYVNMTKKKLQNSYNAHPRH